VLTSLNSQLMCVNDSYSHLSMENNLFLKIEVCRYMFRLGIHSSGFENECRISGFHGSVNLRILFRVMLPYDTFAASVV
jgi:hypothetical protein